MGLKACRAEGFVEKGVLKVCVLRRRATLLKVAKSEKHQGGSNVERREDVAVLVRSLSPGRRPYIWGI